MLPAVGLRYTHVIVLHYNLLSKTFYIKCALNGGGNAVQCNESEHLYNMSFLETSWRCWTLSSSQKAV